MKQFKLLIVIFALFCAGCRSIGPNKVTRDRFDYSYEMSESWKKQMLLNIIKLRYLDVPIFLDVGQLVTGYSLETSVNLGGSISGGGGLGSAGAQGRYTDRPTITYTPLTGERFLEGFLTPIRPVNVFSLVQSGYPADFVLELCLDSFNGLYNRSGSLASNRQPNPDFFHVLSLMREVQDAGGFGMRIKVFEDGRASTVFFFRNMDVAEEIQTKASEVRRLLQVPPEQSEFELIYSPMRGAAGELSVGTRSLYQVLESLGMGIIIPESHLQRQLVPPMMEIGEDEPALFRVLSSSNKPKDSYVEVLYEDEWFWIANDDWVSKRSFSSLLFLFSLTNSNVTENLPTITIPAY